MWCPFFMAEEIRSIREGVLTVCSGGAERRLWGDLWETHYGGS